MSRVPLGCGLLGAILLAACSDATPPTQVTIEAAPIPSSAAYLVLLRDTVSDAMGVTAEVIHHMAPARAVALYPGRAASARPFGAPSPAMVSDDTVEVLSSLHAALVTATDDELIRLRNDPAVAVVEPVRPTMLMNVGVLATRSWGLDRIDQIALPLDGKRTQFSNSGTGVRIALFDTGIRWSHSEVAGRVAGGYDAFTNTAKSSGDAHGHGTLTASLAAGTLYGTAPGATLLDVRVMNAQGSGTSVELVRGADWAIAEKRRVAGPMVVNMSLGVPGGSTVVDALVDRMRAAGIVVVVAAGNNGGDACAISPARAPGAITVAATDAKDARPSFSNGGACVDLSAPGAAIPGASMNGDATLVTASGTSMAAPFVAGAAAVFLAVNKTAAPDAVASWILSESTAGKVTGLMPGTPNRLLAVRRLPGTTAPTPTPTPKPTPTPTPTPTPAPKPTPTATTLALTASCAARVCTVDAGVPASVSAADAPRVVYAWTFPGIGAMSGTGMRRYIITFQSARTLAVTVTAKLGTTTVGTATTTLTVK